MEQEHLKGLLKGPVSPSDPTLRDVLPQVVFAFVLHSVFMHTGINMSYSATTLPEMLSRESSLRITPDQASWIASLVAIATLVGSVLVGPPMDLFGRKACALATCVPLTLGWLLMALTPDIVWPIYLARILTGLGGGMTTVSLVYIAELCHPKHRGMLLCFNSVFVSMGMVVTNVLGVCLHWRTVAACSAALSIASLLGIWILCPESPQWILSYRPHNTAAAKKAFYKLYSNKQVCEQEWDILILSKKKRESDAKESDNKSSFLGKFTCLNLLPLAVLTMLFLFQQLCGAYPIFFYAVNLFQAIGGDLGTIDEYTELVLLGVTRLVLSIVATVAGRSVGRRTLLMLSGIGMALSSFVAAIFYQNKPFEGLFQGKLTTNLSDSIQFEEFNSYNWIGLFSIICYISMCSIGFLIIPWSLIGELLPLSIRGVGSGFIICFTSIITFGAVKIFPTALDLVKISGAFYFFFLVSILGTLFVYYLVPETLGKTFDEIEKYFKSLLKNSSKA